MSMKMKIIGTIGLSRFAPRWLKVACLQLTMNEIESGFKKAFAKADFSKITEERRNEINSLISRMNPARK